MSVQPFDRPNVSAAVGSEEDTHRVKCQPGRRIPGEAPIRWAETGYQQHRQEQGTPLPRCAGRLGGRPLTRQSHSGLSNSSRPDVVKPLLVLAGFG